MTTLRPTLIHLMCPSHQNLSKTPTKITSTLHLLVGYAYLSFMATLIITISQLLIYHNIQ
eukprot:UN05767